MHSSGKTVTEVARELRVSAEGLRNWVKQDTVDRGQGASGELTTAEREELRRCEGWQVLHRADDLADLGRAPVEDTSVDRNAVGGGHRESGLDPA